MPGPRRRDGSAAAASTIGPEFQVNSYTSQTQAYPRVALGSNGEMLVVWVNSTLDIAARRISLAGPQGAEFYVNSYVASAQSLPAVAGGADGSFAVVWQSTHDGDPAGIFAHRFDSAGAALTDEFQVNVYTVGTQLEADIAGDGTDFVTVWQSAEQDGNDDAVFARKISGTGTVEGGRDRDQGQGNAVVRSVIAGAGGPRNRVYVSIRFEFESPTLTRCA